MHLNGNSDHQHLDENDEMLEAESRGVAGRVADLERRMLEQGDELVCLKATLAETLRRVTMLEGMRLAQQQQHHQQSIAGVQLRSNGLHRPTTIGGNSIRTVSRANSNNIESRRSFGPGQPPPAGYMNQNAIGRPSSMMGSTTVMSMESRNRRAVHYQSTGSLHSDSHSSSSVSPIPSPSPRATPQPGVVTRRPPSGIASTPPPQSIHLMPAATNVGGGGGALILQQQQQQTLHKRWSSTGDFNHSPNSSTNSPQSKYSTKSFMNLYKPSSTHLYNYKHGGKDAIYNEEDHTVKIFLRGRPIILAAPTEEQYDITKVATAPTQRLKLDWVYGYRGRDCRSNLYLLPTGEMVYFVAATVVLYNVEEQNQRHYLGHTDDVKSLAIHPNKLLVATGQCAGHDGGSNRVDVRPHVRVWDSVNLSTLAVIGVNEFSVSVCCLSFSKGDGGNLLLAVDEAPDHVISVWDWAKGDTGYKITETKCSVDTIVAAEFHPLDRNSIVTVGKSHIAFWTLDVGGTLFKRMGIFEGRDKPKYVLCVAFLQTGDVITGDSNGNLAVWTRGTNTIGKFVRGVHDGGVFSVCVRKDGSVLTGGGKDGRLVHFDASLNKINDGNAQIEGHYGGIRVVSEGRGSQLLVGTTRNCILTGDDELGYQPIMLGHTDELWALAPHPVVPQFASGGHDKLLQLWDSMSHTVLWSKDIGEQIQSIAFSHDGAVVVVGCINGRWMTFDSTTRECYGSHTDGAEPIQVIQYSPCGNMIALGSRDNHIYVYQVTESGVRYSRIGKCMGHSSFITHLDWSADSAMIRSNSGDYELLYWNATTCRQIPQSNSLRDTAWATDSCTITFSTIGIWPENADGTDVNACNRSHDSSLLATGDDFGKVKLYAYPATQPKSLHHTYGGHSSHVTNVAFLHDDTRLVTLGGKDMSVLQWTVL